MLQSFNRTFMELKYLNKHQRNHRRSGFNRTFMELKLRNESRLEQGF